jgi:hypothetical protein
VELFFLFASSEVGGAGGGIFVNAPVVCLTWVLQPQ